MNVRHTRRDDVRRLLDKITKLADDIGWEAGRVKERLERCERGYRPPSDHRRQAMTPSWFAKTGVAALALVRNPDGSWHTRIDGGRSFRLPAALGTLLQALAAPGGKDVGDGLVGWKPTAEVGALLGTSATGAATRRRVARAMWKLRVTLEREAQNRFLVQSGPLGVRFALRRSDRG